MEGSTSKITIPPYKETRYTKGPSIFVIENQSMEIQFKNRATVWLIIQCKKPAVVLEEVCGKEE